MYVALGGAAKSCLVGRRRGTWTVFKNGEGPCRCNLVPNTPGTQPYKTQLTFTSQSKAKILCRKVDDHDLGCHYCCCEHSEEGEGEEGSTG